MIFYHLYYQYLSQKDQGILPQKSRQKLKFFNEFRVSFKNNLAERDLRMIKVKEKISGSFASFKGVEIFCRISGYISTLKKNNISVLQGLKRALVSQAYLLGVGGC